MSSAPPLMGPALGPAWPAERTARRGPTLRRPRDLSPYLMNAPAVAIILVLIAYPLADAFWTSLHRFNLKRPNVFAFIGGRQLFPSSSPASNSFTPCQSP